MKQNTQPASAPGLARQPRARVRARLLAEENAKLRETIAAQRVAMQDAEFLLRKCGTNWREAGSMADSMKRSAADLRELLAR